METRLPINIGKEYSSRSQLIRVLSEYWVNQSIYCPNCGGYLSNFNNNKPVADFYCKNCFEEYELKSKQGNIGRKLVNGAYSTMIERLAANNNPNFFFLTYNKTTLEIRNFITIPKYFIIPDIIERRKPLNISARRAGWVGCNIVVNNIPEFGKIYYIQDGIVKNKENVLSSWRRTEFVKSAHDVETKGWMLDVLNCVERIKKNDFTLDEVYKFESYLKIKHPQNNNIKAKIRQQLQYLRDKKVIDFVGRGKYRINI